MDDGKMSHTNLSLALFRTGWERYIALASKCTAHSSRTRLLKIKVPQKDINYNIFKKTIPRYRRISINDIPVNTKLVNVYGVLRQCFQQPFVPEDSIYKKLGEWIGWPPRSSKKIRQPPKYKCWEGTLV